MNNDELKALIANLSEDDAVRLSNLIDRQFGWTGVSYTRQDAEEAYRNVTGDDGDVPSDYWQFVQDSHEWRSGVQDSLTVRFWDIADEIARSYLEGD